jgi:hypothetical protein
METDRKTSLYIYFIFLSYTNHQFFYTTVSSTRSNTTLPPPIQIT